MSVDSSKIYREKTLLKVTSPEQLDSYVRVIDVRAWIVLGAVILFIVGALIWCATVTFATETVKCAASVKNGEITVYFNKEDRDKITSDKVIKIGGSEYILPEIEINGIKLFEQNDSKIIEILDNGGNNNVYSLKLYADIPNGVYEAKIITADVSPFELMFN